MKAGDEEASEIETQKNTITDEEWYFDMQGKTLREKIQEIFSYVVLRNKIGNAECVPVLLKHYYSDQIGYRTEYEGE